MMPEENTNAPLNPQRVDNPVKPTVDQPVLKTPQESNVSTFRERTLQRLGSEDRSDANFDGPPSNQVIEPDAEVKPDAHQPDDGYPDEELPPAAANDEQQEQQPTGDLADSGVENTDVEGVLGEQDVTQLRQRAEEAETLVESMQTDYTQKTQRLGESRRELLGNLEQSENLAKIYSERATQALSQKYQNVNWQQLQSTLDPQTYNQHVAEYQQAVQARDREVNAYTQIQSYVKDQREKHKQDEASISRDVLQATVPGWGNDLYQTLREHAVNSLDFPQDEFDQITDHRVIKLIHNSWKVSQTGKKIENIQHNGSRARQPSGANKAQPKGADGKYRQAMEKHLANPGDRDATRDAFRERLNRERRNR